MNISMVIFILGWVLLCEAALLVLPLIVSVLYAEQAAVTAFGITIALCLIIGFFMRLRKPKNKVLYTREGFVITALTWIVISIMGALPFVFSGAIPNFIDAFFETVSGFTTTGACVVADVEALPRGIIFWRSFTHWVGGMGVLVFLLSLLPLTGGSHVNLMKAESPGPQVEKLVPKVQSTAKILYGIYLGLTLVEIVLLLLAGMPLFDSVTLSFGTAGTGGFGIKNDSMGSYTMLQQGIVTVFMILCGVNFNAYFMILLRKFDRAISEEVRWYFIVIGSAVLMITLNVRQLFGSVFEAFHHAAFQVGSIITTTGYGTVDFDLWPSFSKTILVILMFIGACAGSTGGGIKVSRFILVIRSMLQEFRTYLHPQSVSVIKMDGKAVPKGVVRATNVYMGVYGVIFAVLVLIVSLDGYDLVTTFTAVSATFNNIGPGLALVGPTANFGLLSPLSKVTLSFGMLAGRLELFPLLLLFHRETWKKQ
ncbi:MAG: TrkH family potassium uptake protein [Faecalibacterium sp.]|nr:TrkH family potassium uptake protein [Faecalibacterium sp.]